MQPNPYQQGYYQSSGYNYQEPHQSYNQQYPTAGYNPYFQPSPSPPSSPPPPTRSSEPPQKPNDFVVDRKPQVKLNDVWATILFIVLNGLFFGPSIYLLSGAAKSQTLVQSVAFLGQLKDAWTANPGVCLAITAGFLLFAVVACYSFVSLLHAFPIQMIYSSLVFVVVTLAVSAALCFTQKDLIVPGIVFSILAFVYLLIIFCSRKKIRFTARVLAHASLVYRKYVLLRFVAIFGFVFNFVVQLAGLVAINNLVFLIRNSTEHTGLYISLALLGCFVLIWTAQIVESTIHVVVSGASATKYLVVDKGTRVENNTVSAIQRTLFYSFGSICLGSLLVATMKFLRYTLEALARNQRTRNNNQGKAGELVVRLLACFAACLLQLCEDFFKLLNHYAFIFVAIYGTPFMQSARDALNLFASRGLEVFSSRLFITEVANAFRIFMACFYGISTWLLLSNFVQPGKSVLSGFGWLVGLSMAIVFLLMDSILVIINSSTSTFVVCFCMDETIVPREEADEMRKLAA